jgi:hypothetical protein
MEESELPFNMVVNRKRAKKGFVCAPHGCSRIPWNFLIRIVSGPWFSKLAKISTQPRPNYYSKLVSIQAILVLNF